MKRHKIKISPVAEADMLDCFDYISTQLNNPLAALDIMDDIEELYTLLEETPFMGEEHITEGGVSYRFVLVKSYMMFYKVQDDTVLISRFLYGPSNYSSRLNRS